MKIDRVILASDSHENYLPFWKYAAKSWARLGINPTLFLISNNDVDNINIDSSLGDVYRLNCGEGMHTAFVSQCIRLLCPAMFLNESVIIADIDNFPLSAKYFLGSVEGINDENFVSYRAGVCGPNQIAIPWNLAKGSTWADVFEFCGVNANNWKARTIKRLQNWYPNNYRPIHKGRCKAWFTDQALLKKYITSWKHKNNSSRLCELKDVNTGFYRLDRSANNKTHTTIFNPKTIYSDFSPPRPLKKHINYISNVLNHYQIR
jgi:hypothetical protein